MTKLIFSLLTAVLILVFASQNMAMVPVRFIVGPTIVMPLVFVMAIWFVLGYSFSVFASIMRVFKRKQTKKKELGVED
ncbi:MAG: DUF1049 domain-containing protein [SAR324 cluster bacterium]|nr:DUF1049 domain-containing protein [SAR324 cluster bacterium]